MNGRIMIFNDDEDTLEMYKLVLEYEGYTTFTYLRPQITQDEVEDVAPDLIVLDWMYGREERGVHLLQLLDTFPSVAWTPKIVCTAAGEQRIQQYDAMLQAKHISVLHKPFRLNRLHMLIRAQIGLRERTV